MPVIELIQFIREVKADVVGLSLSVLFHMDSLRKMVTEIQEKQIKIPIIIGGHAFRLGGAKEFENDEGVTLIKSLDDLYFWIHQQTGKSGGNDGKGNSIQ